ncbi:DUF305 domain-containing protein [Chryseobacterium salipaludis]|uniref:DUF305 domain-containing protein n=1 Tax=Chryseobacterium TaxID=59732 RepID=UPI001FF621E8|nr:MULTISPECIES: DUF305 domain-containing protein [Chryseobacterium]MCJ8498176.1 DUF305 domain-containing protein [Chryseobacterium salipaludis]MCX3297576.1 DUF305 domain-containing protein [Planobacterium sp. JC490]
MEQHHYRRLALMLLISFVIMYSVMFLNVHKLSHIYLSLTRTYMSLLMVTPMAVLMLLLMPKMYQNQKLNRMILISAGVVFVFALTALRSQAFVGDKEYMKGMIPHHSSAILTSENANIRNPQVRQLSDSIIAAQEKEIAEMKMLLDSIN